MVARFVAVTDAEYDPIRLMARQAVPIRLEQDGRSGPLARYSAWPRQQHRPSEARRKKTRYALPPCT